ncbi:MAG: hypothetical protein ACR2NF_06805 [Pirellulales bacterium]
MEIPTDRTSIQNCAETGSRAQRVTFSGDCRLLVISTSSFATGKSIALGYGTLDLRFIQQSRRPTQNSKSTGVFLNNRKW